VCALGALHLPRRGCGYVSESSEMRHAKLEWGYPPPKPSFIHRIRTALIATAVGAAAGGIVVFSFVDRSVDNVSVTLQGRSTQVASTPMLPLNSKRINSESMKAAEVSGHSESAAANLSSTSSTVPGPESSPSAEERTTTYHAPAKPMADGAKTSAGAVALLETNAPKRHRITTSEARGGQRGFAPGRYYMRIGAAHPRHAHRGWIGSYQNAGWRYDSWD
jgi:hypothetical protein